MSFLRVAILAVLGPLTNFAQSDSPPAAEIQNYVQGYFAKISGSVLVFLGTR
jgi:hypothetical protein